MQCIITCNMFSKPLFLMMNLTFSVSIVFAGARLSCLFQAWQMIPIAAVQSITNASPVLVMLLSHIILDDRMTLIKSLCCVGYSIGVMCVFKMVESITLGNSVNSKVYTYVKIPK